jgi:hypothetical protein
MQHSSFRPWNTTLAAIPTATSRGSRVERIAVNIRFALTMFKEVAVGVTADKHVVHCRFSFVGYAT